VLAIFALFISTNVVAQGPWNDKSCISIVSPQMGSQNEFVRYASAVQGHYEQRFLEPPNIMIWQDINPNEKLSFGVSYTYWLDLPRNQEPSWNDSTLTWGELRQHFQLKATQVSTQDTSSFPIIWGDSARIVSDSEENAGWSGWFDLTLSDLSITNFNNAWRLWVEPIGAAPPPCNRAALGSSPVLRQDTMVVVQTPRTTPTDTLMWSIADWESRGSVQLAHQLLVSFPNQHELLRELLTYYYYEENCDSVSRIGNHYINVLNSGLDPFYESEYPMFMKPPNGREAANMIQNLCVENDVSLEWRVHDSVRGY